MDKKKIGIAVGCAAVAAVIAICAVAFGGKMILPNLPPQQKPLPLQSLPPHRK